MFIMQLLLSKKTAHVCTVKIDKITILFFIFICLFNLYVFCMYFVIGPNVSSGGSTGGSSSAAAAAAAADCPADTRPDTRGTTGSGSSRAKTCSLVCLLALGGGGICFKCFKFCFISLIFIFYFIPRIIYIYYIHIIYRYTHNIANVNCSS